MNHMEIENIPTSQLYRTSSTVRTKKSESSTENVINFGFSNIEKRNFLRAKEL